MTKKSTFRYVSCKAQAKLVVLNLHVQAGLHICFFHKIHCHHVIIYIYHCIFNAVLSSCFLFGVQYVKVIKAPGFQLSPTPFLSPVFQRPKLRPAAGQPLQPQLWLLPTTDSKMSHNKMAKDTPSIHGCCVTTQLLTENS